jgi:hypothetical protein
LALGQCDGYGDWRTETQRRRDPARGSDLPAIPEPHPERDDIARGYERQYERGGVSLATGRILGDALVQVFRTSQRSSITTARAAPQIDELWNREAAAELAREDSHDARSILAEVADDDA